MTGERDVGAESAVFEPPSQAVTIITGLSGAGRSEAARCLEDLGWFVIDNLPPALIEKMSELASLAEAPMRVAFVVDVRGGRFFTQLSEALYELKERGVPYRILFLEASEDELVNRFEASRRPHPLGGEERVVEAIRRERPMMAALREEADLVVDTTGLTPHELRDRIRDAFSEAPPEQGLQVTLMSFGFRHGTPRDADLVLDARFLPNPHWVEPLRPLPGTDDHVKGYVKGFPVYKEFMKRLRALLNLVIPAYVGEGKSYLTIAVGCTGGRHRSVVVVEELRRFFKGLNLPVAVEHRDLDRRDDASPR